MKKTITTLNYGENMTTTSRSGDIVNKKESSFIIVFLREHKPWGDNEKYPQEIRDTKTPVILLLERWDGRQGFIGGEVDNGESIFEAAIREAEEETTWKPNENKVKPLISHSFAITTHSHSYEVETLEELETIRKNIENSKHWMDEITGSSLSYIGDLGRSKGLTQVLKKNMATSCVEELVHLIIKENLVDLETLKKSCEEAGLDFETVSESPTCI